MAHYWHTPHIAEIEDQIKWEMVAVERGVERAREQMDAQALSEGSVGSSIMTELVPRFVEGITRERLEAQDAIASASRTSGRPELWWWMNRIISSMTDLPAKALNNMVLNISGVSDEGFWVKFIADDGVSGDGGWQETVAPGDMTNFDAM